MNTIDQHITLTLTNNKSDKDIATKLHRQFVHPALNKLIKLINSPSQEWRSNENLKAKILKITIECNTCHIFKKLSPRPVVELPMVSQFPECVAIDLKFYRKHTLLHIIDHATPLSASAIITSKKPHIIISKIFQLWISVYGLLKKFLSDKGREFANDHFTNMCKSMKLHFKLTSTESPCSNDFLKRQNLILGDMLNRILEE